jgi:hypothetical protein
MFGVHFRQRTVVLLLTLLTGCCPCGPADYVKTEEAVDGRTQEADVWATLGDYYGPPAPIVLDPPPVPPEIMGPTPLDRLPKK